MNTCSNATVVTRIVMRARKGRSEIVLAEPNMPVRVLRREEDGVCLVRQDNMDYPPMFYARAEELQF
jgi:hypothetical protein